MACFDQYPFSLACALMGIEQVMTRLMDDRSMVEALVVSSGCTLAPDTPAANLHAMLDAVHNSRHTMTFLKGET